MIIPSIHLRDISKKYNQYYLYKNFSLDIFPQDKIVVTGNNGSGKSTLLKIIIGLVSPTSGKVDYVHNNFIIEKSEWYKYISVAAPYMSSIEEFTVLELINHLYAFRKYQTDKEKLLNYLELDKHLNKPIKQFSSGMKQKTKLLFAIMDIAPILLLDEPTSNLDANTIKWYQDIIEKWAKHKTIIVFSNSQKHEYLFCQKEINLNEFLI
mgnify:CR=1 FL=1